MNKRTGKRRISRRMGLTGRAKIHMDAERRELTQRAGNDNIKNSTERNIEAKLGKANKQTNINKKKGELKEKARQRKDKSENSSRLGQKRGNMNAKTNT